MPKNLQKCEELGKSQKNGLERKTKTTQNAQTMHVFWGGNQKKHKMHKKNALKCKTHPPHMTEFQTLTPILTLEPKKCKSGHETKKRSWSKKTDARFTTKDANSDTPNGCGQLETEKKQHPYTPNPQGVTALG